MSAFDQPLLIANSGYHIGHQMSVRAAEEQGFFQEEGLLEYAFEGAGLIPGPFEREGLSLVMKERGVDIATAVNLDSLILHRARGADLYVVGAWRHMPAVKLYAAPHITSLEELRGARVGGREPGGITELFVTYCLSKVGINAATDIQWVYDPVFSYRRDPAHMEAILAGKVDAAEAAPPYSDQLLRQGYRLILDSDQVYPTGRPGKVVVASSRTIERRGEELKAFLRGNIRGFWFVRDSANFEYLKDLEARLRQATHNEDERRLD